MGPILPLIMAAAPLIGKIAGGAAQGSANQRASENNQISDRNSLLAQLHNTRQGATMNALQGQSSEQMSHANMDLNRRQFALNAPDARMSQSVRGSLLANAQPFTLSGLPDRIASRIPQMSGGLSPALFSAETRQLGQEMTRKALMDQLRGDEFEPLQKTNFAGGVLADPKLEQYQRSGLLEKILGGIGLAGSIVGGISEASGGSANRRREDPYAHRTPPYVEEDV